jgi:anthranilate synthase component I
MTTAIATDLLTPLGAYLRLREGARASFLLESVERGRLGRYSFVGSGSRLVYLNEAEAAGLPVVGYVSYDWVAKLEPTVPLPGDGPGLPESRFVVADTLIRFDHVRGIAEVLHGDAHALDGPQPPVPGGDGVRGALRRFPDQPEHERRVEQAKEYIRAGDAFQIVVSQRAERPTSASALELYRALRRVNPSPYLFLLELDGLSLIGSSPETVVKCDGRRAELNPIAGSIAPGAGASPPARCPERRRSGRCRSSRSSRATVAACTRAQSGTHYPAAHSTRASRSERWCCATASRCCKREVGSSRTRIRRRSIRSA